MRRGWAIALLAAAVLTGGTIWALVTERVAIPDTVQRTVTEPISGRSAFNRWIAAETGRGAELAAFFDPGKPAQNRVGRFHVDGTCWRSWGFTKKSASSGCNKL